MLTLLSNRLDALNLAIKPMELLAQEVSTLAVVVAVLASLADKDWALTNSLLEENLHSSYSLSLLTVTPILLLLVSLVLLTVTPI
jgi:hypothetical protein